MRAMMNEPRNLHELSSAPPSAGVLARDVAPARETGPSLDNMQNPFLALPRPRVRCGVTRLAAPPLSDAKRRRTRTRGAETSAAVEARTRLRDARHNPF